MHRNRIIFLVAALVLISGCVQKGALNDGLDFDTTTIEIVEEEPLLELSIEPDKEIYSLNDKSMKVVLVLGNIDEVDVKPYHILDGSSLIVNGEEVGLSGRLVWREDTERILAPDNEFLYSMNLKRVYGINESGDYTLQWRYGSIASNNITVEVIDERE